MEILKKIIKGKYDEEEFEQKNGAIHYTPNNRCYLNCMEIELRCVEEEMRTGEIINREYICPTEHSVNFLKNGLLIPTEMIMSNFKDTIEVNLSLVNYKTLTKGDEVKLEKTGEVLNAKIIFDFNTFQIIMDDLFQSPDLKLYFTDNCYTLWETVSANILYKFKEKGVNVLDKIKFIETGVGTKFRTQSLMRVKELFELNQYHIDLNTNNDYRITSDLWSAFDKNLLKSSPTQLLEAYGIEVSPFTVRTISKNLYNLFLIKKLLDLNFNKRDISILLSKNAMSLSVLETKLFKLYLNNLSKKDIVRRLTKSSDTIQTLLDIDCLINDMNLDVAEINLNLNLINLEKDLLNKFNNNNNDNLIIKAHTLKNALSTVIFKKQNDTIIRTLTKYGFTLKQIKVLIDRGFSTGCLNSNLFKFYLENLPACEVLDKFEDSSNILSSIKYLDKAIDYLGYNLLKTLKFSNITDLELELTLALHDKGVSNVISTINYSLPDIDYSKDEHLIYESSNYSLHLPLKIEKFKEYGEILKNCIGATHKRILSNGYNIMVIKDKDSAIIGAIKIDKNFEVLIEAKGYDNGELNNEEINFVIKFCNENEIICETYFERILRRA